MDIRERLNRCCGKPIGGYNCHDGMRCPDCFDKLEGLREIEGLNERVETLRQVVRDQTAHGVQQMKEIERLREALRRIGEGDTCVSLMTHPPMCKRAYEARSALQQKDSE